MFDLIGFDLDGTLVDTATDLAHATNHALALAGRPALPVEMVRGFVGNGARRMLIRALGVDGAGDEELASQLLPELLGYYAAHIADHSRPYDGVEDALDRFAAEGVRLAICTNKREDLARALIDAIGWTDRFAVIVGGDTAGALKPDPAPLAAMIEKAGGERTLFVGDSDNDTRAAQALGLPVVLFTSGYGPEHDPASLGADAIIGHFSELYPAVTRLAAR